MRVGFYSQNISLVQRAQRAQREQREQREQRDKVSFKQIKPEFMFINAKGFAQDNLWAKECVKIIDLAKQKCLKKTSFKDVLGFISQKYSDFYTKFKNDADKRQVYEYFGQLRGKNEDVRQVSVASWGKYSAYRERLSNLAQEKGFPVEGSLSKLTEYNFEYLTRDKQKLPLAKVKNITYGEGFEDSVHIKSAPSSSIKPVLEEVEFLFDKILQNKKPLTEQNTKIFTKEIAKIHWLVSQAWPFTRGSAGIADILSKILFETKGIQVSPYKKGINPNMESFCMSIEEYAESYAAFFTEPLTKIKQ